MLSQRQMSSQHHHKGSKDPKHKPYLDSEHNNNKEAAMTHE